MIINPNEPKDFLEGSLRAGAGNHSLSTGEGMVNVAVTDTVAVRAAGSYTKHDGYVKNLDDRSTTFMTPRTMQRGCR